MVSLLCGLYFVSCSKKEEPVPAPIITFDIGETNSPGMIYTYNRTSHASNYIWDFGDGAKSEEEEPYHTYTKNGTYRVTLRAIGKGGESSSSQTITISSLSSGNPSNPTNPTSPKTGRAIFFTSQTSGWSSISVAIDGVTEGSFSSSFSSTPSCGALGALTIGKSPGTYAYTARSNTGVAWNGTVSITENGCQPVRLDFPTGGTISDGKPTVETLGLVGQPGVYDAQVQFRVVVGSDVELTEYGILYVTGTYPTNQLVGFPVVAPDRTGKTTTLPITELVSNTTYSYVAYATTTKGVTYIGAARQFTTGSFGQAINIEGQFRQTGYTNAIGIVSYGDYIRVSTLSSKGAPEGANTVYKRTAINTYTHEKDNQVSITAVNTNTITLRNKSGNFTYQRI